MNQYPSFNVDNIRLDFPCLTKTIRNNPLVYFDNAATAQKPNIVIKTINEYYQCYTANINRGPHFLSDLVSEAFDEARVKIASFLYAKPHNIIFTKGTTESINLVATCLGKIAFNELDEIIISEAEHHANIVPWFLLAKEKNLVLRIIPVLNDGSIDLETYTSLLNKRTKLVALTHVSNVLGIINPIEEMIKLAKTHGAITLIDGAQAIPHLEVNLEEIDSDFYCFSGHKLYGPTGIGILYAKDHFIEAMPPYQSGGDMIEDVNFDHISFKKGPQKFEAGTPNISSVLGLKAALDYIDNLNKYETSSYEQFLYNYLYAKLKEIKDIKIIGTANPKIPLISFAINGIHSHDVNTILDAQGIAIRSGHLCAQPLIKKFNLNSVSRASLSFYNTISEIDYFLASINKIYEVFKK